MELHTGTVVEGRTNKPSRTVPGLPVPVKEK